MGIVRFLKPVLFILEFIRISILVVFVFSQPADPSGFTRPALVVSGTLFPLMALFIWLDTSRYKAYLPLFTAGKCIGIPLLTWSYVSLSLQQSAASRFFSGTAIFPLIDFILLSGDIFALVIILLIIRDTRKMTGTPALTEIADTSDMEVQ